jgi:hypothetical protein
MMRIEDIAPALNAWDRLDMAINGFVVAQPADITQRAARLSEARAAMARQDLPEQVQQAWTALQQTIGTALVSAPHEMSASVERLAQRRLMMRAAFWDLAKLLTPVQTKVITDLAVAVFARPRVTRRARR